ncbi:MAG: DUF4190 domain-containing protein [Acidimicrobiales bacterium]
MSGPGGAGWWQGPDGGWHPPGAGAAPPGYAAPGYAAPGYGATGYGATGYGAPGYAAPGYGAPGYGAPGYAPPRTSGLAIASLISSLVWVVGVGSLLAVAFGIAAKVSIHRSGGTLRGSGLSTAGIVVGAVGLAGAAVAALVAVSVVHRVTTPTVEPLGRPVSVGALATVDGVDRVTVFSVTPGAPGLGAPPPPGDEFVSAHLRLCVSSAFSGSGTGTSTTSPLPTANGSVRHFFVYSTTGQAFGAQPEATGVPNLYDGLSTVAGSCSAGFLTFSVPVGQTPSSLRYDPTVVNHYEWRIPGR